MTEALQEEPKVNGVSSDPSADSATSQGQPAPLHDDTIHSPKPRRPSVDKDAQDMVIDSLRTQIQDLISQVSQLNSKLVKSYDRVSDLEDDLHVASANLRTSSIKISQLELERTQHLSALNTGLLVEKTHVTAELNRLMEKATEEAAQRGQAESARMAIEKDLDDLSASLFGQANSMVAEARFQQYQSDRKREDAEVALKGAEEAVQLMQTQMQTMQTEREEAEKKMHEMQVAMGKGKWVNRGNGPEQQITLKFLNSHAPFQEFITFVGHLRVLHSTSPNPPAMSTLLPLPFLARLLTEDSEPTIRLDLAPSLNWLSRRSVLAAIHSGQLTIEPISAHTLIHDFATQPNSTTVAGMNTNGDSMCCALCGSPVLSVADHSHPSRPPLHPSQTSWSTSFFKRNSSGSLYNSQPPSPTRQNSVSTSNSIPNTQIYIFRMANQSTTTISSLPIPSLSKAASPAPSSLTSHSGASSSHIAPLHSQAASPNNQTSTIYPLCQNGWCLTRLRTTCTLWAFVRTNIVDKVWDEDLPPPPAPAVPVQAPIPEKPPVPPRKRGLWGIASAIGERAASWGDSDKDKSKKTPAQTTSSPTEPRRLPPPLPPTPTSAQSPPPLPSKTTAPTVAASAAPAVTPAIAPAPTPPPLPRRAEGRSRTTTTNANTPRTSLDQSRDAPKPAAAASPAPEGATTMRPAPNPEHPPAPVSPLRKAHFQTIERAHTPSNIPLPESRPGTPGAIARAASPATVATGSGPAPPPLPRRAAARSRGGAPVPSRSATPANGDAIAVPGPEKVEVKAPEDKKDSEAKIDDKKEDEQKVENKESEVKTSGGSEEDKKPEQEIKDISPKPEEIPAAEQAPVGPKDEETAEPSISEAAVARSMQGSPGSDEFVDAESVVAPSPAPSDIPGTEEKKPEEQEQAHKEQDDPKEGSILNEASKRLSSATIVNGHTVTDSTSAGDSEKPSSSSPHSVSNGVALQVTSPTLERLTDDKPDNPRDVKEDPAQDENGVKDEVGYLGDATWEERTWKDLVRLREDMFFARIGVVRE